ncbi:hypothetical protein HS088_TW07G01035 [Tripterygium wilfordii]|uniref:Uncharacterized protein n=1 Tax=Tripterygium wilfordii TaxID=458696 RepID=A0A7J7DGI3_TRIWF|nr:hypothetical protein HS088_TW07G01035 [Tripterygium wilfordii]
MQMEEDLTREEGLREALSSFNFPPLTVQNTRREISSGSLLASKFLSIWFLKVYGGLCGLIERNFLSKRQPLDIKEFLRSVCH